MMQSEVAEVAIWHTTQSVDFLFDKTQEQSTMTAVWGKTWVLYKALL